MKKSIFVIIAISLIVIATIACAGCTSISSGVGQPNVQINVQEVKDSGLQSSLVTFQVWNSGNGIAKNITANITVYNKKGVIIGTQQLYIGNLKQGESTTKSVKVNNSETNILGGGARAVVSVNYG